MCWAEPSSSQLPTAPLRKEGAFLLVECACFTVGFFCVRFPNFLPNSFPSSERSVYIQNLCMCKMHQGGAESVLTGNILHLSHCNALRGLSLKASLGCSVCPCQTVSFPANPGLTQKTAVVKQN